MIAKYLHLVIGLVALLAFVLFALGVKGYRKGKPAPASIILLALFSTPLMAGGALLMQKAGAGALVLALLFDVVLTLGFFGGLVGGIRRSRGRSVLGMPGMVIWLLIVLVLGFVRAKGLELDRAATAIGLTDNSAPKEEVAERQTSEENLKQLYIAFQFYAQDWDALPPAANWMDNPDIKSKVTKDSWFHDPAVSNGKDDKFGYAYNATLEGKSLGGKMLKEQPEAATTPLLYESENLEKSAADKAESLPKQERSGGKNMVLYLDGSVKAVTP